MNLMATSTEQQDLVHKQNDKSHGAKMVDQAICHRRSRVFHNAQSSKFTPACHHCGVKRHIRP
ncbi:hypothetical protein ACOSQ2_004538 [Xanthoceras sorbifolium]